MAKARVMRFRGARCLFAIAIVGCGGASKDAAQPEGAGASATRTVAIASPVAGNSRALAKGESSNPAPSKAGPNSASAREQREPSLVLPAYRGPVDPPIRVGDSARYKAWRQVGQTRIGKGYLYFLDALSGERWLIVKSAVEPDVRIIDIATRREVARWPVANLGQDESHVVLAWQGAGEPSVLVGKQDGLWLYAAESGRLVTQLATHPVDRASWSDDGQILVTAELTIPAQTARLRFYQAEENGLRLLAELPQTQRVDAWALSRDNRYLARVFYPSDQVTVVDLHTGLTLLEAPAQRYVGSVEFSPNGRWLVLGGEGVKLFDLSDSTRRTEYTHFYNNVGDVEFSPSGDVLATASFDGQIRLLTYDEVSNRFSRLHGFSHQKNTNVYALKFLNGGRSLASSAGDQVVRFWAGAKSEALVPLGEPWRSPAEWAEWGQSRAPASSQVEPSKWQVADEHYAPARLSGPPASSRITPGEYECKISTLYKLRRCIVEVNESGHTMLEFDKENLLGLRGVLYDDGAVVRFEGWLTDGGSLGCSNCVAQPLHAVFRGNGASWQGLLLYRGHYDPRVPSDPPSADVVIEEAIDRFPLVLRRK